MKIDQSIFHAYDIRGTYPDQINEKTAKRIAMAYVKFLKPKVVAVGCDVRLSSPAIKKAVIDGLTEAGAMVIDIGSVPTDMLYYAVAYYHYDGGIQVTASHNPAEFNGMKIVRGGSEVIIAETGLNEIRDIALSDDHLIAEISGEYEKKDILEDYLDFIAQFADFDTGRPMKIVANSNFGYSGPVAAALLKRLANDHIQLIELNFQPDGSFPKGRPDPLVPSNQTETSELIRATGADFGVAWDADGDRCFFADETGEFASGCNVAAIFATELLKDRPGEKILHDIRNIWAIEETVRANGGVPLVEKVGHGFFKNRMRKEQALFAGEMSGHYYFRDFFGLDNGLIPFVLFLNKVATENRPVSEMFKQFTDKYFVSGEINFNVDDKLAKMKMAEEKYPDGKIDRTDGLSVTLNDWRFNIRPSNNENLLRLNVEALDQQTCDAKTAELSALLEAN